jgi:hypothetical protein
MAGRFRSPASALWVVLTCGTLEDLSAIEPPRQQPGEFIPIPILNLHARQLKRVGRSLNEASKV